jgi:hypothetical protein
MGPGVIVNFWLNWNLFSDCLTSMFNFVKFPTLNEAPKRLIFLEKFAPIGNKLEHLSVLIFFCFVKYLQLRLVGLLLCLS